MPATAWVFVLYLMHGHTPTAAHAMVSFDPDLFATARACEQHGQDWHLPTDRYGYFCAPVRIGGRS